MFKYFLKERLRNRLFIFWSMIFPLALMTCFKVAFGNLSTDMDIDTKNIAVIHAGENKDYSDNFDYLIDELTKEGTNKDKALFIKKEYENEDEVMSALSCGVYFGTMVDIQGEQVELANVRNIWNWCGASCLSQIANHGIKRGRVSPVVKSMVLNRCCQIMPLEEEAVNNLESQPIWS